MIGILVPIDFIKNPKTRSALIFLGLLMAVCLILYQLPARKHFIEPFTAIICKQAVWLLNLLGVAANSDQIRILGAGFSVTLKAGCNAVYEIALFVCAVVAYPSEIKKKLFGVFIGSSIIYVFNLIRVILLFLTGVYFNSLFNMVHDHVSQTIFIFFVVVLWLFWASSAQKRIIAQ